MAANNIQLPFQTSHAFIIGIDDYQHVSPLHTAVNDAKAIAQRLQEQHGFSVHPPLLNVTHADIKQLLREQIPQVVGKDDRVLFYFAGHGIALDSEEGPNGYIVAADTKPGQEETLVAMNTLHDALTSLPCRHGLLILDCCFSGAFKWSSGFRDVVFDLPKVIYEERFWRYCKDPAWQVITSAAHDQKAVDIITNQSLGLREEGSGEHSPFASSLLRALDGAGDVVPQGEGDGVITATELYSYLRDSVETQTTENAKRQSPSLFNLQRHDKGEFIFLNPHHRFNLPPTPDRNPFMGLSSYNEADTNLFYGRDRVVESLLAKVRKQPLTVVSGASGTGKSSVIKAGLLPQLRLQNYTILPIIRPGKDPLETIATELPDIDQQLAEGAPVLVIDQYEELITQCLHEEERQAFEQQLAKWLQQYPDLRIILSIRSDFEPQFESEALAPWWLPGRYVVPSFSLEEIREVITKPASQAVLFYEPEDLVEQLSEEVSQAPGALPLLSFTLSELYHAYLKSGREDRALTEADYKQLGGVIGALRTRADAEYQSLNPEEQSSMRKLMLRMVSLEGGELAGKRVYAEELEFSDPAESKRLQTIANQLVDARLLLKGQDGQGRTYVEPAHDALVRAWARLWEWIKTVGEEKISLQYKLNQAVNDYHGLLVAEPKKARNLLWNSNPRLDLLEAELAGKDHHLNAQEETFVSTSIKRRAQRKRTNWTIAISVMVGLVILALFANSQRIKADSKAVEARSAALGSKSMAIFPEDNTAAMHIANIGHDLNPEPIDETQQALFKIKSDLNGRFYTSINAHDGPVSKVIFSITGDTILTAGEDGQVFLWNKQGKLLEQLREKGAAVRDADISPDGKIILYGTVSGEAVLTNMATGKRTVHKHRNPLTSVRLLENEYGFHAVTGDSLGSIWYWNESGRARKIFNNSRYSIGSITAVNAFVSEEPFDSRYPNLTNYPELIYFIKYDIAQGKTEGSQVVWLTLDGKVLREDDYAQASLSVRDLEYSQRYNMVMQSNSRGIISFFPVPNFNFQEQEWKEYDVRRNPDHQFFKTVGTSFDQYGLAKILPLTKKQQDRLSHNSIFDVLVVKNDMVIRLKQNGQEVMRFSSHQGGITDFDVSPNGLYMATGGNDGRILMWNIYKYRELTENDKRAAEWCTPKLFGRHRDERKDVFGVNNCVNGVYVHPNGEWQVRFEREQNKLVLSRYSVDLQEIYESEEVGEIESISMSEDGRYIYTKGVFVGSFDVVDDFIYYKWPNHTYEWENGLIDHLNTSGLAEYGITEEELALSQQTVQKKSVPWLAPNTTPIAERKSPEIPETLFGNIIGTNVRVRKEPVNGAEITKLSEGARVEILQKELPPGEYWVWCLIKHENYQGWTRIDFIEIEY
jgi:WD40 repeat protein